MHRTGLLRTSLLMAAAPQLEGASEAFVEVGSTPRLLIACNVRTLSLQSVAEQGR